MPLIVLVTVTAIVVDIVCWGCCKNEVVIVIVAGISELHGNDTIDQVATNWTKSTRIPDDDELFFTCMCAGMCVCIFYWAFSCHLTFVFTLFTIIYFLLFSKLAVLFFIRQCIHVLEDN